METTPNPKLVSVGSDASKSGGLADNTMPWTNGAFGILRDDFLRFSVM
jgi:hypothetical protein